MGASRDQIRAGVQTKDLVIGVNFFEVWLQTRDTFVLVSLFYWAWVLGLSVITYLEYWRDYPARKRTWRWIKVHYRLGVKNVRLFLDVVLRWLGVAAWHLEAQKQIRIRKIIRRLRQLYYYGTEPWRWYKMSGKKGRAARHAIWARFLEVDKVDKEFWVEGAVPLNYPLYLLWRLCRRVLVRLGFFPSEADEFSRGSSIVPVSGGRGERRGIAYWEAAKMGEHSLLKGPVPVFYGIMLYVKISPPI